MWLTLHKIQETKPIPPITPTTPVRRAQLFHHTAKSSIQPFVDKPWIRMNMRNANGRTGIGKRVMIVETVGKRPENTFKRLRMHVVRSNLLKTGKSGDGGEDGRGWIEVGVGISCNSFSGVEDTSIRVYDQSWYISRISIATPAGTVTCQTGT